MKRYLIRGILFSFCMGTLAGFNYHANAEKATQQQKRSLLPAKAQAQSCDLGQYDPRPIGYVHRWCTGHPHGSTGCTKTFMCKTCKSDGTWTSPVNC